MTRHLSAHLVPRLVVVASLAAVAVGPVSIDSVGATDGGNVVDRWNAVGGEAAIAACLSPTNDPLHEARMYAIAHVAIHDALNALDRRFEPYAYHATAPAGASAEAAVPSVPTRAAVYRSPMIPWSSIGRYPMRSPHWCVHYCVHCAPVDGIRQKS